MIEKAARAALAASLGLAALAASAQERGGFGESVEVELISVDVLAIDRDGRAVTDLAREDFRLLDEGRPVAIDHFSRPPGSAGGAVAGEGEPGRPGSPRRAAPAAAPDLLVLFLDQLHLIPTSRDRALRQVAAVLDERLDEGTEVLVATFDGVVEVPLPPTRDRRKLWQVLAHELVYGAQALQLHRGETEILRDIRQLLEVEIESLLGARFASRDTVMDLACDATGLFARTYADQERSRVEATAGALQEFLVSMAAYRGRKTLLHVSDGVPLVAGLKPMEYLISLCDGTAQMQGLEDRTPLACCPPAKRFPARAQLELQAYATGDAWNTVAAEANRQRVTLYTLQASGLAPPEASGADAVRTTSAPELAGRVNDQDPLVLMARETGGRAMLNTNDYRGDLARMLEDRTLRYELGFYPQGPPDGRVHALKLEVDRPGVRLLYRRSYTRRTAGERAAAAVLAALYHDRAENPHRVRLEARLPQAAGKRTVEVDVELRVPLASLVLLPDGDGAKGLITVYASARDARGATLPVGERSIPLRVGPDDGGRDYRYVLRMPLARGRDWLVAVALRDEIGDAVSTVTAPVRLAD